MSPKFATDSLKFAHYILGLPLEASAVYAEKVCHETMLDQDKFEKAVSAFAKEHGLLYSVTYIPALGARNPGARFFAKVGQHGTNFRTTGWGDTSHAAIVVAIVRWAEEWTFSIAKLSEDDKNAQTVHISIVADNQRENRHADQSA